MKARQVAEIIEDFAPLCLQESWDNAGFCIGSPEAEVKGIMVGFDCTPSLIEEAAAAGCNMIVTHHPLIFKGVKKINPDTFLGSAIVTAIKHDMVVYAAHTNADKAADGVSRIMAEKLGLTDIEPLDEDGLGAIGVLPEAMESKAFIDLVKKTFGLPVVRCSRPLDTPVRRVAMCGGSGGSLIEEAEAKGADAYLCGDLSYHSFFTDAGFMLLDVGHYESEIDIVNKLFGLLSEKIHTFAVRRTQNNNNPIYYY
ncbi:MAG: Nif3-like dinuclear metal center hexameric protein [Bacteroidales bacterium]|nr:Nif3-like dinuclear metal center hexameric protein [Bacteroidales bacterium]